MLDSPQLLKWMQTERPVNYAEWAEQFYVFPKGDREPGRYRIERTPYVRDILEALSPTNPTQKVVFIKPTQIGATTLSNILLSAIPHASPAHCALVFPTEAMAMKHMKKKLSKAWGSIKELSGIIKSGRGKDGNTITYREFPGGSIVLAGSGAIDVQRSDSIQVMLLTDVDSKEFLVHGEGDPIEVFIRRTDAYGDKKKIFIESTPLTKGSSIIEGEYKKSSKGRWLIPCLKCGGYQWLEFGGKDHPHGFKFTRWKDNQVRDAYFICEHCHKRIEEKDKFAFLLRGRYVHEYPENPVKGFKISGFHSPAGFVSWKQMADEWLKAHKHPAKLQVFVNTRLAESFEMPGTKELSATKLRDSAENYPLMTVPAGADCVAIGVDTHDNRLDAVVIAFSVIGEAWVIGWFSLWGDPNTGESFEALDDLRTREFYSESGDKVFRPISVAVDVKGHRTDAIKNYVRTKYPQVIGVQGAVTQTAPILGMPKDVDLFYNGEKIKGGFKLWSVGTFEVKSWIFGNLSADNGGMLHLTRNLPFTFFDQLTAQQLKVEPDARTGAVKERFVNIRPEDHGLDATVYCIAGVSRVLQVEKIKQYRRQVQQLPPQVSPTKRVERVPVAKPKQSAPLPVKKRGFRLW